MLILNNCFKLETLFSIEEKSFVAKSAGIIMMSHCDTNSVISKVRKLTLTEASEELTEVN